MGPDNPVISRARVAEWQTRKAQDLVSASSWGFKSPLSQSSLPRESKQNSDRLAGSAHRARRNRHRNRGQARLILVVVGGFAAARRPGRRARLHIGEAVAGGLGDIGIGRAAALLLRHLVAIGVSADHPASRGAKNQDQAESGKFRKFRQMKTHGGLRAIFLRWEIA